MHSFSELGTKGKELYLAILGPNTHNLSVDKIAFVNISCLNVFMYSHSSVLLIVSVFATIHGPYYQKSI